VSLPEKISNMNNLWNRIERRFDTSHDEWNDQIRDQFDREYWEPLRGMMPNYMKSLDDLNHVVQQAKQNVR
jgi:hypothetical protein